jgi:hypothetical protein
VSEHSIDAREEAERTAYRVAWEQKFAGADDAIDHGFAVLPAAVWLQADGTLAKCPLLVHGHLEAHRDKQLIRQQLVMPPHVPADVPDEAEVVVGFVPGSGGCGVLDADVKKNKPGKVTLKALVDEHGDFLGAWWRSPSGGTNVLWRKPDGAVFSNRSPWPGIDVRSDGGWVVAPGQRCENGAEWHWGRGGYSTAGALPDAMVGQLRSGGTNERPASSSETLRFIEASPNGSQTSPRAMQAFSVELEKFKRAEQGSRHEALVGLLGWCCGMVSLDLRWALAQVKQQWLALTPGEGREDEVGEALRWVVGQESKKRAADSHEDVAEEPLEFIDWTVAHEPVDDLVERYIIPGRWTQNVGSAKDGKSSLTMWVAIELSEGRDPFDGSETEPVSVIYCDGEMGRLDLEDLIRSMGHDPAALPNLHCTDARPRLDTVRGAERLLWGVDRHVARLVVLDGLNGFINPEADENYSSTWRQLFDCTVKPLKERSVAVVSNDNMGKDPSKGSRGNSAKNDKADGVVRVMRTDEGVRLTTPFPGRGGAYLDRLELRAEGFDGRKPIRYWRDVLGSWPTGTQAAVKLLDRLDIPVKWGGNKVRQRVRDAGEAMSNEAIAGAIRYRKANPFRTP